MAFKGNNLARTIIVLATELLLFILLMCNWVGVSYVGDCTLWEMGKVAGDLGDMASMYGGSSGGLVFAAVLVYILLIGSLGGIAYTCFTLFTAPRTGKRVSLLGFMIPGVLAVLMIFVVIIANASIKNETGGWIDSLFVLTASPILTLVFGAGAVVALCCIPQSVMESMGSKIGDIASNVSSGAPAGSRTATGSVKCPSCGAIAALGAAFCPACGAKMPEPGTVCPKCCTPLNPGAGFCHACGAKIVKPKPTVCPGCGSPLAPGASFCTVCGMKIE